MAKRPIKKPSELTKAAAEDAIKSLELTVRFLVTDYSVEFLAEKVKSGEYYVPEYQRKMVWGEEAQSRFIESVLIGLPIPFVFLWQDDEGRMEIVDGSQRLRTLQRFADNQFALTKLQLLSDANGFRFSDFSEGRQRKFNARVLRGIVLENATTVATRTEMFARINTGGTSANDAEIRRGSLPGLFTNLVIECAEYGPFVRLTPISPKLVNTREREELVVRFFTFLETYDVDRGDLPDWRDRPREYIFTFVEIANRRAAVDPLYIDRLKGEFERMVNFVAAAFPSGFAKTAAGKQVPRARFEAIAVGSGLALRARPEISDPPIRAVDWIDDAQFKEITTSDAANVRAKVTGRIEFVRRRLLD